jgi:hypothetical protein
MRIRTQYFCDLLLSIASIATISSASAASIEDIPLAFRRDVTCMINVLRKTPRVDQVESGVIDTAGSPSPFVGYRYTEQDGRVGVVRFVARKADARFPARDEDVSHGTVVYWANLNGLTTPGVVPPTFGTGEIAGQWKLRCGVSAIAVFN